MSLFKKFKLVLVLGVLFSAIYIFNTNTAYATTFKSKNGTDSVEIKDNKVIVNYNRINYGETTTTTPIIIEYENMEGVVGIEKYGSRKDKTYLLMNQESINKFNSPKEIPYIIKMKASEDTVSVKSGTDGVEASIENINGEKWLVFSGTMHYLAEELDKNIENEKVVSGYKNDDIARVWSDFDITYYKNDDEENPNYCNESLFIMNKNAEDIGVSYELDFINKKGIRYSSGGMGGGKSMSGKFMLNVIYNYEELQKIAPFGLFLLPKTTSLNDMYMRLSFDTYQGDTITLIDNNGNSKGTLYYSGKRYETYFAGMTDEFYTYTNKLSELNVKENELILYKRKLKNGQEIMGYARTTYRFSDEAKEEVIEVTDSTKNEYNIRDEIGINYYGNATFNSVEIEKDDPMYDKIKEKMDLNNEYYKDRLYFDILDIYLVNGNYDGKLILTFDVGEKYNGKYYSIWHYKKDNEYERFQGIVENGKITITVDSLSPFGIQIFNEKVDTNQEKADTNQEKDDTPNTKVVDIIPYVSIITIISILGIVVLKKKFE